MPQCDMVAALKERSHTNNTTEACLQAKAGVLAVCAAQQAGWCDDDVLTTRIISEYMALKHFDMQHDRCDDGDYTDIDSFVTHAATEQLELARMSMGMILNLDTGSDVNEQFTKILRRCFRKMG